MRASSNKIFIGTMSGTSHDGIDICAIKISNDIALLKFGSYRYPNKLQESISRVIQHQELSLSEFFDLNKNIGIAFSKSINKFLKQNKISKNIVSAIGMSGQTLFHNPKGKYPFSIQAGDPKIIANECRIDVVSDFRNDHIKLGGEGAPLVPEFHQKIFHRNKVPLLIVNIGGISNFSYLDGTGNFYGSDCGPGNALMDIYCQNYLNRAFDREGKHAEMGIVHALSLKKMLSHPFFRKHHPKSTGKEIFNMRFIPKSLLKKSSNDVLATLTELTAVCIAKSIKSQKNLPNEVIICGGGVRNKFLIHRINMLTKINITSSDKYGFDPQAIEAMAFGWMARQRVFNIPLIVKKHKGLLGNLTQSK